MLEKKQLRTKASFDLFRTNKGSVLKWYSIWIADSATGVQFQASLQSSRDINPRQTISIVGPHLDYQCIAWVVFNALLGRDS